MACMTTHDPALGEVDRPDGGAVLGRRMTEEEFLAWCDQDTRAEWVDGEVVMMAPVSDPHSDLVGWLGSLLRIFVELTPSCCRGFDCASHGCGRRRG